jgi:hypothetical protein
MSIYVDYNGNPVHAVSNTPVTILDTSVIQTVVQINGITVCNTTNAVIRFNLQKVRTQESPITINILNQVEIAAYQTMNITNVASVPPAGQAGTPVLTDLCLFLQYSTTPSMSEQLVAFTNGYTQIFDCDVTYTQLNQTPLIF